MSALLIGLIQTEFSDVLYRSFTSKVVNNIKGTITQPFPIFNPLICWLYVIPCRKKCPYYSVFMDTYIVPEAAENRIRIFLGMDGNGKALWVHYSRSCFWLYYRLM